jgi:hypothetical protein
MEFSQSFSIQRTDNTGAGFSRNECRRDKRSPLSKVLMWRATIVTCLPPTMMLRSRKTGGQCRISLSKWYRQRKIGSKQKLQKALGIYNKLKEQIAINGKGNTIADGTYT